ncbi:MAG: hypothetical protein K2Q09_04180, partial [Phycisphaerales bacterium]|nr:hypothetical protein [Phycisphaerales bacterium]
MKTALFVALVAGTCSCAVAAPQESVSFTSVASRNLMNAPGNEVRTATFTGAYTVQQLTVSGLLTDPAGTGTYTRESAILVTPPSGSPFIIQPYGGDDTQLGQPVPAGSFSFPITPVAAAGNWSFQFFEYWDDTADDAPNAVWSNVTITLDDAPPAVPAPYNPSVSRTLTNVAVTATPTTDTWTVPAGTSAVDTIAIRALGVGTSANTGANINASPLWRVRVRITAPGRNPVVVSPFRNTGAGQVSASAATGEAFVAIPGGIMNNPAGAWTIEVFDELGTSASFLRNLSVSLALAAPPSATPFPALTPDTWVSASGSFTGPGQVRWYALTVPATVSAPTNSALDLDMLGTSLTPENDASFALYSANGARLGATFNTGPGFLPQLSFGKGTRPGGGGDALPFDGADSTISPAGTTATNLRPTLTPGTYYLAVVNGDTGTAYGAALFNVTPTTESNTGTFTVRARYQPAVTPVPPEAIDLGTLSGNQTLTATIDNDTYFVWYRFSIPQAADDSTGHYVDIDTANTPEPLNDTNLALYTSAGNLVSLNDDIAPGWGAANPTGGNSAMSFGAGSPSRDYSGVNANMPAGDGRDGPLPAGNYYLQVSPCCAGYGDNNFWVINDYVTNPDAGSITVRINSDFGSACGPADLGSAGGVGGSDNQLNNND